MADAYFHSGYYPSIFDQSATEHDVAEDTGAAHRPKTRIPPVMISWGRRAIGLTAFGPPFCSQPAHPSGSRRPLGTFERSDEVREILPVAETRRRTRPANDRNLHRHRLLAAPHAQARTGPRTFCAKDCAIIRATTSSCSNWAGFTMKTVTMPAAPGTSGKPPCAAGKHKATRARTNVKGKRLLSSNITMNLAHWRNRRQLAASHRVSGNGQTSFAQSRRHAKAN